MSIKALIFDVDGTIADTGEKGQENLSSLPTRRDPVPELGFQSLRPAARISRRNSS
jgi:phosphoglycolate phosphatase-like HAD superfamily hydrolase